MRLHWRTDFPEQAAAGDTPFAACERLREFVSVRARANERRARVTTSAIVVASALIPVCLVAAGQGDHFVWGRLLPALLAATSGAAAGSLQLDRAHDRWRLYRTYQRRIEDEVFRFENHMSPYDGADTQRELQMAETVLQIRAQLHRDWGGLVPTSSAIAGSTREGS